MNTAAPNRPPPTIGVGDGIVLTRTRDGADGDAIHAVIAASRDHLRPWMPWADQDRAATEGYVERSVTGWERGTTFNYAVRGADGAVLGAAGLHRRGCADVLEIGYWLGAGATGRGIMATTARALADAAVALDGVDRVAIRCDHRNRPSSAVAQRAGFWLLGHEITAASERHEAWEWSPGRTPAAGLPLVTVRPAQPDDADALVALFSAVAGEGRWIGGELPLSDAQVARLRASASRPVDDLEQLTVLADDGGDVVGWLTVYRVAPGRAGLGMALAAAHRGRGLGRRLLDRAAGWAREREMHKLELEVWPHNERARRLYEATGFVTEGYRHRHWRRADGSLWDAIDMALVLDTWSPGMPAE